MHKRLTKAREYLGLTKTNFARELGLKSFNIRDMESGKQKISAELATKLEEIFSISGWWLLTGKGTMLEEKVNYTSSSNGYEVEMLSVKASAGEGINNYQIEVIDKIIMDKAFFRTEPDIKKIKIIQVDGDSMYPTLQSGDHVIIDETQTHGTDGIYAIQLHNQILIKRLQFNLDGTIDIKSDNKSYDTKSYDPKETQIELTVIGMKTLTIQR